MNPQEQAKTELIAAQGQLPAAVVESQYGYNKAGFQAALEQLQLSAAIEILACVIDNNPNPGKTFWGHMIKAAELLGGENIDLYRSLHDVG